MSKKESSSYLSWLQVKRLERYPQDMGKEEHRLRSFKDWPFLENCACTPQKMAEAGFYHCPNDQEPDLVRCYVCLKELDGWEPEDEPWKEHKRSKDCEFVKRGKKYKDITLQEYLKLEVVRHVNELKKIAEYNEEQIDELDQLAVEEIERLRSQSEKKILKGLRY